METVIVKSKKLGSYKAFKNEGSKSAFKNKMTEAFLVELKKDDVVVDIGAYIGEYSMHAAISGAKRVYAYEPTSTTFKVLAWNCRAFPSVIALNEAVVGTTQKTVELSYNKNTVGVTNSIVKRGGKLLTETVKASSYTKVVKGASVVKIDCEGAEYQFDIVQPDLRAIILEFHPVDKDWQSKAYAIMKHIKQSGFKPLALPKFAHGWDMHGAWIR